MTFKRIRDIKVASDDGRPTFSTTAFGSVPAAYAGSPTLSSDNGMLLDLYNGTDVGVSFSFDGTNTRATLAANTGKIIQFGANGMFVPASIYIKYTSGAPTSGSVDMTVWS